jgi:hypothetical protein
MGTATPELSLPYGSCNGRKLRSVTGKRPGSRDGSRRELKRHERIIGVVLIGNPPAGGRPEAEALVISGFTQNNHKPGAKVTALFQGSTDERGPYALSLSPRRNRNWPEPQAGDVASSAFERHGAERDVAYYFQFVDCHQGEAEVSRDSQGINDAGPRLAKETPLHAPSQCRRDLQVVRV